VAQEKSRVVAVMRLDVYGTVSIPIHAPRVHTKAELDVYLASRIFIIRYMCTCGSTMATASQSNSAFMHQPAQLPSLLILSTNPNPASATFPQDLISAKAITLAYLIVQSLLPYEMFWDFASGGGDMWI
jgi:hypothetical protein